MQQKPANAVPAEVAGSGRYKLTPSLGPPPSLCSHIHTNPFQLQELREEWLQEGCSFTNWFEVCCQPGSIQAACACRRRILPPRCTAWFVCSPNARSRCNRPTLLNLTFALSCLASKQAGDYHDTLMLPMVTRLSAPRVRMQPGEFTGYTVR